MKDREELQKYIGNNVIIDVDASLVYIGKLTEISEHALILEEVDVHDFHDSRTTKEMYIMETKKYGVRANRKSVHVRESDVISLSLLDDVIDF